MGLLYVILEVLMYMGLIGAAVYIVRELSRANYFGVADQNYNSVNDISLILILICLLILIAGLLYKKFRKRNKLRH